MDAIVANRDVQDAAAFTPVLPAELWRIIFNYLSVLDFPSIRQISETCKSFAFLAQPLLCHTLRLYPEPSPQAYEQQLQKLQLFAQPRCAIEVKSFSIFTRRTAIRIPVRRLPPSNRTNPEQQGDAIPPFDYCGGILNQFFDTVSRFVNLRHATVVDTVIKDEYLSKLASVRILESLELRRCHISYLAPLSSTSHFSSVTLDDCSINLPTPESPEPITPRFPFTLEKFSVMNQPTDSYFTDITHSPMDQHHLLWLSLLPPTSPSFLQHLRLVGHATYSFLQYLARDFEPFTNLQILHVEALTAVHPQFVLFISNCTALDTLILDYPAMLDAPEIDFDNTFPSMTDALLSATVPPLKKYWGPDYNLIHLVGERPIEELHLWGTDGSWAFSSEPNELLELLNSLDQRRADLIEVLHICVIFATGELLAGICEKFGSLKVLNVCIREESFDPTSNAPGPHFEEGLASVEVMFWALLIQHPYLTFNIRGQEIFTAIAGLALPPRISQIAVISTLPITRPASRDVLESEEALGLAERSLKDALVHRPGFKYMSVEGERRFQWKFEVE